jgi:hypothetical protein
LGIVTANDIPLLRGREQKDGRGVGHGPFFQSDFQTKYDLPSFCFCAFEQTFYLQALGLIWVLDIQGRKCLFECTMEIL